MNPMSIAGRALVQAGILAAAGTGLLVLVPGGRVPGLVAIATAVLAGVCGVLAPRAFLAAERWFLALGRATGIALTWALLSAFYLSYFVPGRLILVLMRRDPLRRRPDAGAATYWSPARRSSAGQGGDGRYRRQY